ncbi:hypothetical protein R6Z07F_010640 [Ovis aries]
MGAQLLMYLSIHLFRGPLSKQEASLKQEANKACLVTTYPIETESLSFSALLLAEIQHQNQTKRELLTTALLTRAQMLT